MKKLLLFITIAITAISSGCGSDNNTNEPVVTPTNFMRSTVNGVDVNYDVIATAKENYISEGVEHTDLVITASKSDDPSKSITFSSAYLEPGTDSVFYFELNHDELEYDTGNPHSFVITLAESTANSVKGTFTGTLSNFDNTSSAVITNGNFDIKF
ncbi:MAG TPA: hypothetical protein VK476_02585 [Flavobacterium sp.]|nr:hypothetical protein [Flavobacterium sp.]